MEHAKKMVLIDEKLLDSLKTKSWEKPMRQLIDRQSTKTALSWKKPADVRAKTSLHLRMKQITDDPTLPDDVRVKLYTQELCKFQRIRSEKKPIKQDADEDDLPKDTPRDITVDDLIDLDSLIDAPIPKQKKPSTRKVATSLLPGRPKSQRKRASKILDLDWKEY